jgi:hypothetical protein
VSQLQPEPNPDPDPEGAVAIYMGMQCWSGTLHPIPLRYSAADKALNASRDPGRDKIGTAGRSGSIDKT